MDYYQERKVLAMDANGQLHVHSAKPKPTAVKRQILQERHVKAVASSTVALESATAKLANELALEQVIQCDLLQTTERVAALVSNDLEDAASAVEQYVAAACELQLLACMLVLINERVLSSQLVVEDNRVAHLQLVHGGGGLPLKGASSAPSESGSRGSYPQHVGKSGLPVRQEHSHALQAAMLAPAPPAPPPRDVRTAASRPMDAWELNEHLLQMLEIGPDSETAPDAGAQPPGAVPHAAQAAGPMLHEGMRTNSLRTKVGPFCIEREPPAFESGMSANAWLDGDDSDDEESGGPFTNMMTAWSARTGAWASTWQQGGGGERPGWEHGNEEGRERGAPGAAIRGGASDATLHCHTVFPTSSRASSDAPSSASVPMAGSSRRSSTTTVPAIYAVTHSLPNMTTSRAPAAARPTQANSFNIDRVPAMHAFQKRMAPSKSFPLQTRPLTVQHQSPRPNPRVAPFLNSSYLSSVYEDRDSSSQELYGDALAPNFAHDKASLGAVMAGLTKHRSLNLQSEVDPSSLANMSRAAQNDSSAASSRRSYGGQPALVPQHMTQQEQNTLLNMMHAPGLASSPGARPPPPLARSHELSVRRSADPLLSVAALQGLHGRVPPHVASAMDSSLEGDDQGPNARSSMLIQIVDWLLETIRQRLAALEPTALKVAGSGAPQMLQGDVPSAPAPLSDPRAMDAGSLLDMYGRMRGLQDPALAVQQQPPEYAPQSMWPGATPPLRGPPLPRNPHPNYNQPRNPTYNPRMDFPGVPSNRGPSQVHHIHHHHHHYHQPHSGQLLDAYNSWPEVLPSHPQRPPGLGHGASDLDDIAPRSRMGANGLVGEYSPWEEHAHERLALPDHSPSGTSIFSSASSSVDIRVRPAQQRSNSFGPLPVGGGAMWDPRYAAAHSFEDTQRPMHPPPQHHSFPMQTALRMPPPRPRMRPAAFQPNAPYADAQSLLLSGSPQNAAIAAFNPHRALYMCKLCYVSSNSIKDLLAHLLSKGHQRRIRAHAQLVLERCLSMLAEHIPQPEDVAPVDTVTLLDRAHELDHVLVATDEMTEVVQQLISKLCGFQSRAAQANPAKGRSRAKKRCLAGIRENMWALKKDNRTRLVVLATNVQVASGNGVLMQQIAQLVAKCKEQNVPTIISLTRKQLGSCFVTGTQGDVRHKAMSAIAVLDISGAEVLWAQLQRLMQAAKDNKAAMPAPPGAPPGQQSMSEGPPHRDGSAVPPSPDKQRSTSSAESVAEASPLARLPESVAAEVAWKSVRPLLLGGPTPNAPPA